MADSHRGPEFDVECPECHAPKAVLAFEHPWHYLCPECEHVWHTTAPDPNFNDG